MLEKHLQPSKEGEGNKSPQSPDLEIKDVFEQEKRGAGGIRAPHGAKWALTAAWCRYLSEKAMAFPVGLENAFPGQKFKKNPKLINGQKRT